MVSIASLVIIGATGDAATPSARPGMGPGSQLRYLQLSKANGGGDFFLNYDGQRNDRRETRDWAVSLIFYDNAKINTVKSHFDSASNGGYTRKGSPAHMGWKTAFFTERQDPRFDSDRGKKTQCNRENNEDYHYRVYARNSDYFVDPEYGHFVVGTTHVDHGEEPSGACGGEKYFGASEKVERDVARNAAKNSQWTVRTSSRLLHNYEKKRSAGNHRWDNDGRATMIRVP